MDPHNTNKPGDSSSTTTAATTTTTSTNTDPVDPYRTKDPVDPYSTIDPILAGITAAAAEDAVKVVMLSEDLRQLTLRYEAQMVRLGQCEVGGEEENGLHISSNTYSDTSIHHTHSTHPFNTSIHHTHSSHPFITSIQHIHSTHPLTHNIPTTTIYLIPSSHST